MHTSTYELTWECDNDRSTCELTWECDNDLDRFNDILTCHDTDRSRIKSAQNLVQFELNGCQYCWNLGSTDLVLVEVLVEGVQRGWGRRVPVVALDSCSTGQ